MDPLGHASIAAEDVVGDTPATPVNPLTARGASELSPSAYELLCRFLGEPGARRLRRYMDQNAQYDENSFLCLDTLLDAAVLEAAAKIPLQIATGLEELRGILADEGCHRKTALDDFLRRFAEAQPSRIEPTPLPRQTAPATAAKRHPWMFPLPKESRVQNLRLACLAFLTRERKTLLACLLGAMLGGWISQVYLGQRDTQQWEQESKRSQDWRQNETDRQNEWRVQQTATMALELDRVVAEARRQFTVQTQQVLRPAALPMVAEPTGTKAGGKRTPR